MLFTPACRFWSIEKWHITYFTAVYAEAFLPNECLEQCTGIMQAAADSISNGLFDSLPQFSWSQLYQVNICSTITSAINKQIFTKEINNFFFGSRKIWVFFFFFEWLQPKKLPESTALKKDTKLARFFFLMMMMMIYVTLFNSSHFFSKFYESIVEISLNFCRFFLAKKKSEEKTGYINSIALLVTSNCSLSVSTNYRHHKNLNMRCKPIKFFASKLNTAYWFSNKFFFFWFL